MMSEALDAAREAFGRRAWSEAFDRLGRADAERPLAIEDLERLGLAAFMIGRAEEAVRAMERAHQSALGAGDRARAARHAYQLGMTFAQRGEMAQAGRLVCTRDTTRR